MIQPIPYKRGISVIKEYHTNGHSPLLTLTEDYDRYVVKVTRNGSPHYELINEFLCHYLLTAWNIPTPEIAAISIDRAILPSNLSPRHKHYLYDTICFGSKHIENVLEAQNFISLDGQIVLRKFINPTDLFLIALFDIWVENDDRKPSNNNLLIVPRDDKYEILAIDHSFVFSSLSYSNLHPAEVCSSFNDTILHSSIGKSLINSTKLTQEWITSIQKLYYLCIEDSKKSFQQIVNNIPDSLGFTDELQNLIHSFLFKESRNKKVFNDFLVKLDLN